MLFVPQTKEIKNVKRKKYQKKGIKKDE